MAVGQAIRRPEWHDCPVFNGAWESLRQWAFDPRLSETEIDGVVSLAREMGESRVIKITSEQLRVVQAKLDELERRDGNVTKDLLSGHIPFPHTFIEIVEPRRDEFVRGVLISQGDETVFTPFMYDAVRRDYYSAFSCRVGNADTTPPMVESWAWIRKAASARLQDNRHSVCSDAVGMTAALCSLLSCSNIETLPEPLRRQGRREAERKNRQIALTVHLKRKGSKSVARGGQIDWTHQFDVRGHFQHHGTGPIFNNCKDRSKRMIKDGKEIVRVWVNPYIKGPRDKDYQPKSRDATRLEASL